MRIARRLRLDVASSCAAMLLAGLSLSQRAPGAEPRSPDNQYLDRLLGDWDMAGAVGAKPVRYHARGERVLGRGFLKLHMIDAATPPTYEADLFLGVDATAGDYVAHWLDRFGAAGARVVASGTRDGERLVLRFPYAEGAFRDTFTFDPGSGTWSLLLESQAPGGAWATFARYTLVRTAGAVAPAGPAR